jgi:hypothetical protein
MVDKPHPKSDSQWIFSGFYQLRIIDIKVTINATIERPQSRTNTMIGADFMD